MGQAHTQGSRAMTLPVLLYQPGTHGNFLTRCLSISSGVEQDFDLYLNKIGAHANTGFIKLVDHIHPLDYNGKDAWIYINFRQSDLYLLNWHFYKAASEFGLDLLDVKSFMDFVPFVESNLEHGIVKGGLENQLNIFKDSGQTGLREMFKLWFKENHGMLEVQQQDHKKFTINNEFCFEWFYNYDNFKQNLIQLLKDLGKEYCCDIEHHWQDFINRKQQIIESKIEVERAMECFRSNACMDISKFCIYQQAYLDHLVEQYLGYEIEIWENGYPQNMRNYKPVQATID